MIRAISHDKINLDAAYKRVASILPQHAVDFGWILYSSREPFGTVTMLCRERPATLRKWFADCSTAGDVLHKLQSVMNQNFGATIRERVTLIEQRYGKYCG